MGGQAGAMHQGRAEALRAHLTVRTLKLMGFRSMQRAFAEGAGYPVLHSG